MTMEDVIEYWDRRPCNVRHSQAPVGSREWSDEVTRRKYFVEPHIPAFAQFSRWRDKNVLEIGCGIGTDTLEFCRAGARVFAIDASAQSVDIAYDRVVKLNGFSDAWIHCVDAEEWIPWHGRDGKFDLVYSFGVLHHTPNPERVLQNIRRAISGEGELRVMLYNKRCLKRFLGEQPEAQANCPLARAYTMAEAVSLFEHCGFEVVGAAKAHVFTYRIEDYVRYRYVKRWYYRLMPGSFLRWLERHFGEHLLIVAKKA